MKKWYTNDISEICIDCTKTNIPEGFHLGRSEAYKKSCLHHKLSDETKEKIKQKSVGRTPWNKGKTETEKHIYYTNDIINIRIPETLIPPEGFHRGRLKRCLTEDQKKHFNESRKLTNKIKYGSENYNNHTKYIQTVRKKYGVDNPQKVASIREKSVKTSLLRYGTKNPAQSEEVKQHRTNTIRKLYNVDNTSQLDSNRYKVRNTWDQKTSEELADIVQRRTDTLSKYYGVTNLNDIPKLFKKCQESKPNKLFADLLEQNSIKFSREFNLHGKWFDFKVGNILIEIDPAITHNCTWSPFTVISKYYHRDKTKLAVENGFRCIHVWDWDSTEAIIELLKSRDTLFARKCEIREISPEKSNAFLLMHHLQGAVKSDIQVGLFSDNKLVSVMTFGKPRYNKKFQYELLRYASSCNITGGAERLFKYFIRKYSPKSIISYCDLSKFSGNLYSKLRFSYDGLSIGRHWYNIKTQKHITDNLLRQRGFDQLFGKYYGTFGKGTSNDDLMREHEFLEIYDAGQATYTYTAQ